MNLNLMDPKLIAVVVALVLVKGPRLGPSFLYESISNAMRSALQWWRSISYCGQAGHALGGVSNWSKGYS